MIKIKWNNHTKYKNWIKVNLTLNTSLHPRYLWMEDTLFSIIERHQKILSQFGLVLLVPPKRPLMIIRLLFAHNLGLIDLVCVRVSIECFVIKTLWTILCRYPCMTFCYLVFLHRDRIDVLLQSEKWVFQQFWTLFVSMNHMEVLFNKFTVFLIFHRLLKQVIQVLSQVDFFMLDSHFYKFWGFFCQERVKEVFAGYLTVGTFRVRIFGVFLPENFLLSFSECRLKDRNLVCSLILIHSVQRLDQLLYNGLVICVFEVFIGEFLAILR